MYKVADTKREVPWKSKTKPAQENIVGLKYFFHNVLRNCSNILENSTSALLLLFCSAVRQAYQLKAIELVSRTFVACPETPRHNV